MFKEIFASFFARFVLSLVLTWLAMGMAILTRSTAFSMLGVFCIWWGDKILGAFLGKKAWYPYLPFRSININCYVTDGVLNKIDGDFIRSVVVLLVYCCGQAFL